MAKFLGAQPNRRLAPAPTAKFTKEVVLGLMYLHEKKEDHPLGYQAPEPSAG